MRLFCQMTTKLFWSLADAFSEHRVSCELPATKEVGRFLFLAWVMNGLTLSIVKKTASVSSFTYFYQVVEAKVQKHEHPDESYTLFSFS